MHIQAVNAIVELCRRRLEQGDHPTERAPSVEVLEDCVIALAAELASLRSEQATVREDAERLDYLEDRIIDECGKKFVIADEATGGIVFIETWGSRELREIIDAERAARTTTPEGAGNGE